jgi:hypothetical protein
MHFYNIVFARCSLKVVSCGRPTKTSIFVFFFFLFFETDSLSVPSTSAFLLAALLLILLRSSFSSSIDPQLAELGGAATAVTFLRSGLHPTWPQKRSKAEEEKAGRVATHPGDKITIFNVCSYNICVKIGTFKMYIHTFLCKKLI